MVSFANFQPDKGCIPYFLVRRLWRDKLSIRKKVESKNVFETASDGEQCVGARLRLKVLTIKSILRFLNFQSYSKGHENSIKS